MGSGNSFNHNLSGNVLSGDVFSRFDEYAPKKGLAYFKKLHAFSPQKCDCYEWQDLTKYAANQLEGEQAEKMFIHIEEFNCQRCNNKIDEIKKKHGSATEALASINRRDLEKEVAAQIKKYQGKSSSAPESLFPASQIIQLRKLGARRKDMLILNGESEKPTCNRPEVKIGQVWLHLLPENRRLKKITLAGQQPLIWPLIITGISRDGQTLKALTVSMDIKMYSSNLTCRLRGSEYWCDGLVELFNEITISAKNLVMYKGELNADQMKRIAEGRAKLNWDLPELPDFSDWMDREIELSSYMAIHRLRD